MKDVYDVIVAEDEPMILKDIVLKTNQNPNFCVVSEAQNGREALDLVDSLIPDVLITDIKMPVINGLKLIELVALNYPSIKIVIISGYDEFQYAQLAIKYGVSDYIIKPVDIRLLIEALNKIKIILDKDADALNKKSIILRNLYGNKPQEIANLVQIYMKENFQKDITLDMIAKGLNYDSSYISKIFKKYYDEPPLKYLSKLRINEAKKLLKNSPDMDVNMIGKLVGYYDQFYFSKVFKHNTGYSPTEFKSVKLDTWQTSDKFDR